jgi:hypothetical protein
MQTEANFSGQPFLQCFAQAFLSRCVVFETCEQVPYNSSCHFSNVPGKSSVLTTSSVQVPRGFSPQWNTVINGHFLKPLELASFLRTPSNLDFVPVGEMRLISKVPRRSCCSVMFTTTCSRSVMHSFLRGFEQLSIFIVDLNVLIAGSFRRSIFSLLRHICCAGAVSHAGSFARFTKASVSKRPKP